jgi:hypothetical protein
VLAHEARPLRALRIYNVSQKMGTPREDQEPFDPKKYLAKMKEENPDSYWWHIDAAYREVNIYDGVEAFQASYAPLPGHIKDLVAAHWFLSEVANGGVMQFFINPTGVLAPECLAAFANLGLNEVAAILEKCVAKLGPSYPRDHDERVARVVKIIGSEDPSVIFSATLFAKEESELYGFGGQGLDRIYDRMDAYAKEKRANKSLQPSRL